MTTKRKFYKTVIQVEILSEEKYNPHGLNQIVHDITFGDCSGEWHVVDTFELDGKMTADALIEQGSAPEFFNLDENGDDFEEENYD